MQRKSVKALIFSLVVFAAISAGPLFHSARAAGPKTPPVGLHVWTKSHAKISNPSDRLGGPLKVEVTQTNGSTRFIIPGPRALDPSVMGTPASPAGLEPAPFPPYGVPLKMRLKYKDQYSITNAATPFSDWREVGVGSVRMSLVDATATDGARTKDKIDFEANFKLPDGTHYRVVVKKPIPHGFAFPYFGGVVTNQILHGASGIGTKLMPSEFAYAAFWGVGDVYRDGKLVNKDHLVHAMLTEAVRGDNYKLVFDRDIGNPPATRTLHLMIPPFKVLAGFKGLAPAPLKTNFIPFSYAAKHMKQAQKRIEGMPDGEQKERMMAVLKQTKGVMARTKEHVLDFTKKGKMFGMPFIHIMFGNLTITSSG